MLAACRQEPVDQTPVWFMRQAGRYLSGYKEIRASHSIIEICKTPSICETVTVMPVKELGVDAAVMFSDIMLPLEGIGIKFEIEENIGPVIQNPLRSSEDVRSLGTFNPSQQMPFFSESIRRVKEHLQPTKQAVIGFSGAPFTLASYIVEGRPSRDFTQVKKLMYSDKVAWDALMSKLADIVFDYLAFQIGAGVDIVQIFDSWVGALSAYDYAEFVAPYTGSILDRLRSDFPDTPTIHFGTNTAHLLGEIYRIASSNVFSLDWRISISEARKILGKSGVQGNLDPVVLLCADRDFISKRVQRVIDDNQGEKGHIFNLGHGILKDTPVENARYVVNYVHENT